MPNHISLPDDPNVALKVVDAQAAFDKVKLERGIVGAIIGARENVPFNTAFLVVIICVVTIVYLIVFSGGFSANKDAIAVLAPFATLFGGYLFGRNSKD